MDEANMDYNKIHAHLNDGSIDIKKLNMSRYLRLFLFCNQIFNLFF